MLKVYASLLIIISFSIAYYTFKKLTKESDLTQVRVKRIYSGEPQNDKPSAALLQEIKRTMDPATGTVPTERLEVARSIQLQRFNQQSTLSTLSPVLINWAERGPDNVGGRTRAILFDVRDASNSKVWAAGVGGGLWYTNNITAATPVWNKVNDAFDNLAITCIAQFPYEYMGNIMYFGTGEGWYNIDAIRGNGIYKSIDGGVTWTQLPFTANNPDFYNVQHIVVLCCASEPVVLASTRSGGVQISTNGGVTWTKTLGNGVGGGSSNEGADLQYLYNYVFATLGIVGSGGGIYRFNTGTQLWTRMYSSLPGEGRIELATNPNGYQHMYAMVTRNDLSDSFPIKKIMRTDTSDEDVIDWYNVNLPTRCTQGGTTTDFTGGQGFYDLVGAMDPKDVNSNTVYIGGIELYKTTDGGSNWTQLSTWAPGLCGKPYVHADQHSIVFRPGSFAIPGPALDILFGNDGGIYRTTDGGSTFTQRNKGYNVTQFYSCALHPTTTNYFLGGTQDNGTQKFSSAGINSTTEPTGGDGGFCFIDQDDPTRQITSYIGNYYFVSSNSGTDFTDYNWDAGGSFINPADYDNTNNILYAGGNAGGFFRWANLTVDNPISVNVPAFASADVTHVKISPQTANRVYFGLSNGSIVRVDNANGGSATTKVVKASGGGSISGIAIDPGNEAHMLVTYSNYGVTSVFETTDGTTAGTPTWNSVEGNLPDMPVRWVMFDPRNTDWAILATEKGIWSTDNINGGGTDWQPTNNNFANTRVDMLRFRSSDRLLLAATHGRGMFSATIPAGSPLPVTLVNFTGRLDNNEVMLNWTTSSEVNSKTFEIERSYNGSDYKRIGIINAAGQSNSDRSYTFHDPDITQVNNYYRLKQVDQDGSFTYSKIVSLRNQIKNNTSVVVLSNPGSAFIDIQIGDIKKGKATLNVIDASGALLYRSNYNVEPQSRLRIPVRNHLPAGVYFLNVYVGNEKYVTRFIKN